MSYKSTKTRFDSIIVLFRWFRDVIKEDLMQILLTLRLSLCSLGLKGSFMGNLKSFLAVFLFICISIHVSSEIQKESEIVVIGNTQKEQKELAGSGTYIDAKTLKTFQEADIEKVLSYVPGVNFRPEEGHGLRPNISLRGTYSDRSAKITLMEDGLLIAPAPYTSSAAYYFPTLGRMSGVEVVKGPSSIQYGPYTIGGAVNLISTPIPSKNKGYFLQELGNDGQAKTHVYYGVNQDHFGALLEAIHHKNDGFEEVAGYKNADTGFDIKDYHAKLRFNTSKLGTFYHELLLKIQSSTETSNQTYVGLAAADFQKKPRTRYGFSQYDVMNNDHQGLSLRYLFAWDDIKVQLTGYQNDFKRDWFKVDKVDNQKVYGLGNGIDSIIGAANLGDSNAQSILNGTNTQAVDILLKHNNRKYESRGLDLKLFWDTEFASVNNKLTLGARSTYDKEDRFQWYETSEWFNGQLGPLSEGSKPGFSGNNRITYTNAHALYLHNKINWEKWTLTGGLRHEDWTMKQDRFVDSVRSALNPNYPKELARDNKTLLGMGASYALTDTMQGFFGYHQGFTPTSGGANPEEADNIELGVRYNKQSTSATLIYFNSQYKNIFGTCSNSSSAIEDCDLGDTFDGGKAKIQGIELELSKNLNYSSITFPLALVYTYTDAKFETQFKSKFWGEVSKGTAIPDTPEHQLMLSAGFIHESGYKGNARARYSGETCSVASCKDNTEIEASTVVDLSLRKEIVRNLEAYGIIDNLFDATDIVARAPKNGIRTQKGRSYRLGLVYTF